MLLNRKKPKVLPTAENQKTLVKKGRKAPESAKIRARAVYEDWKEDGFKNLNKAMIKNGYSEVTASSSGQLLKTMAWKEMLAEFMPDSFLAEHHKALFESRKYVREDYWDRDDNGKRVKMVKFVDVGPDVNAVAKALDLAYKIKGAYRVDGGGGEDSRPKNSTIYNLFFNPNIRKNVKNLEEELKKQLYGEPIKDDDGTIPDTFGGFSQPDTRKPSIYERGGGVDEGYTGEDGEVKDDGGGSAGGGGER